MSDTIQVQRLKELLRCTGVDPDVSFPPRCCGNCKLRKQPICAKLDYADEACTDYKPTPAFTRMEVDWERGKKGKGAA